MNLSIEKQINAIFQN